jgi:hypothetical protein
MNSIELSYVFITYKEPIVFFIYREGIELGFPEIMELVSNAGKLSGGKPYVTFSDVRFDIKLTVQGKKYVSDPKNMPLFRGTAALVRNNMQKIAANFMSYFNHHPYPFKAFVNRDKAIEWLHSLPLESKGSLK